VHFLLEADFSKLTGEAMLAALGQAFFSLSIGMGAIMAYGAYLPEGTSISNTSISVVIADTGMALLAGSRSSRSCSRTAWTRRPGRG
jgi:neurotransmitter:Na+ symporter, NSS family